MDLEECVQVRKQTIQATTNAVHCCWMQLWQLFVCLFTFCIRSQMEHSSSCRSTALICKSWWVCVCVCVCVAATRVVFTSTTSPLLLVWWVMELLCWSSCRVCLTVSWSLMTASDTSAAVPVLTTAWRWSSWTTAPWSQTPHLSTWRAAIVWIALSSMTASRLPAPASRDYGWVVWANTSESALLLMYTEQEYMDVFAPNFHSLK